MASTCSSLFFLLLFSPAVSFISPSYGGALGYIGSLRLMKLAFECLLLALYKMEKSYCEIRDAHLDSFAFWFFVCRSQVRALWSVYT